MLLLKSPAKLNLFLRILARRADGYHELASLFQTIGLHDLIHFEAADHDSLICSDPSLAINQSNLISKARQLFRQKTGIQQPFAIHLEKKIPIQAGLGGGSSNAATTLWALNQLCGRPATDMELASWGSEIGSDISFFLSLGTAYCTGRGEILQPVPSLASQKVFVAKPRQGLSTKQVFENLRVSDLHPRDPRVALDSFYANKSTYFNDLEQTAFELMPELAVFKARLEGLGFSTVTMTGTGSSFFCLGEGDVSNLLDCQSFFTMYINREPGNWY